jgi:autotransporter-associated beta strand protein
MKPAAFRRSRIFLALNAAFAATLTLAPLSARAVDITYPGTGMLQNAPSWWSWGYAYNFLFPGTAASPLFSDNIVTVNYVPGGSITNPFRVFGGISNTNNPVTGNQVFIVNGSMEFIQGGFSFINASNNTIDMNGGHVGYNIIGGNVDSNSGGAFTLTATYNAVTISGGSVGEDIYGGNTTSNSSVITAIAANNTVTISNGSVGRNVNGGRSTTPALGVSHANSNTANISGGSVIGSVYGGMAYNADGADTSAASNIVNISGGNITGNVYGGCTSSDSGPSIASGNFVDISGGSVGGNVYGGNDYSVSGDTTATANTVTVSDGSVANYVYGGYAGSNGSGAYSTATGNFVNISGGSVSRNIVGGYSWVDNGTIGKATGNTVTLSGSPTLGAAAIVYGGFVGNKSYDFTNPASGADVFTDNTLVKKSEVIVFRAQNFATVEFDYSGNANITTLDATPTGSTLTGVTLDTKGNNIAFGGVIEGNGDITKTGGGVLTLANTNTYTGGTTITGGLIAFSDAGNFGSGNITLNGGGLQWATSYAGDISSKLAAIGTGGGTFDTNDNNVTLASALTGNGGVTKAGDGVLTLANTNTYTGGTTITSGTLQIGDGGAAGSIAGNIVNNAALIFNRADALTYGGIISGSGTLEKKGSGTLTLANDNSYSGATTVTDGVLEVHGSLESDVTVKNGATLYIAVEVNYGGEVNI